MPNERENDFIFICILRMQAYNQWISGLGIPHSHSHSHSFFILLRAVPLILCVQVVLYVVYIGSSHPTCKGSIPVSIGSMFYDPVALVIISQLPKKNMKLILFSLWVYAY